MMNRKISKSKILMVLSHGGKNIEQIYCSLMGDSQLQKRLVNRLAKLVYELKKARLIHENPPGTFSLTTSGEDDLFFTRAIFPLAAIADNLDFICQLGEAFMRRPIVCPGCGLVMKDDTPEDFDPDEIDP